ncbi:hypothetical protein D7Z54_03050 [Salibacterium salarium]|uniref:Exopolysaccharide Pel transporter PelG n=1 Tax=Salibacterium salarium TaxID=284579 RepID=A0A3R9Q6Y9_9BACI|nr:hypothetical protein D7Z54_03050 [Salibacterium salarium]
MVCTESEVNKVAGIGFHLQGLFEEKSLYSKVRAYGLAGLVAAGPWIIITLTMAIIQWMIYQFSAVSSEERELFIFSVSYCFIFSQLLFSTQQMTVTRYVSDLMYNNELSKVFPAFLGTTKVVTVLALGVWGIFFLVSPLSYLYKFVLLALFLTINYMWILLLFLSAAKHYKAIGWSFLTGGLCSVFLAIVVIGNNGIWLTGKYPVPLQLTISIMIGMLVTVAGLMMVLLRTFPMWKSNGEFAYFTYYGRFPSLFWIGFLYTLGIWVCNWIIWFGEGSKVVAGSFIVHPIYDMAIFWSYLTILPVMILFIISVETRFYKYYKTFFSYVNEGGTLNQIRRAKQKMNKVLFQEIQRLVRSQMVVTVIVVLNAGYLLSFLNVNENVVQIFRLTAIGAFANGILLVMLLLLLYFEDRKGALYSAIIFFAINGGLTVSFLSFGYEGYGLSFSIGSLIGFVFAAVRLSIYLQRIDYHGFCGQGTQVNMSANRFQKLGEWLEHRQL